MAGPSDYHRGEMDVAAQASTYRGFLSLSKWGSLYLAAGLLFWILWLCAHAGFFRSAIAAVVMVVLGTIFMREKKSAH